MGIFWCSQRTDVKSQNNEIYNKDFNLDELVEAIQLSNDSAKGPDEIHYQMLKHLPDRYTLHITMVV